MRRSIRVTGNMGSRRKTTLRIGEPLLQTWLPATLPSVLSAPGRPLARSTLGTLGLHAATTKESCACPA